MRIPLFAKTETEAYLETEEIVKERYERVGFDCTLDPNGYWLCDYQSEDEVASLQILVEPA